MYYMSHLSLFTRFFHPPRNTVLEQRTVAGQRAVPWPGPLFCYRKLGISPTVNDGDDLQPLSMKWCKQWGIQCDFVDNDRH